MELLLRLNGKFVEIDDHLFVHRASHVSHSSLLNESSSQQLTIEGEKIEYDITETLRIKIANTYLWERKNIFIDQIRFEDGIKIFYSIL